MKSFKQAEAQYSKHTLEDIKELHSCMLAIFIHKTTALRYIITVNNVFPHPVHGCYTIGQLYQCYS